MFHVKHALKNFNRIRLSRIFPFDFVQWVCFYDLPDRLCAQFRAFQRVWRKNKGQKMVFSTM